MGKFKNKTVFISGGTSGIGLAAAKEFINEGASVIITGRHKETIYETVKFLGDSAYGIVSDAASMHDILRLKLEITQFRSTIDIVFANAGYGKFAPIETVTEEMFDELFTVLVKGTYFTIKELLPLINTNGSVIINTSIVTEYGSPGASVYSAAKAAVQSMVKTLASEFVEEGIRINAVSPGYTETDIFNKTGMIKEQISATKDHVKTILPFKRFAEASEIAKAVCFLASEDASYIHGTELRVDGGYTTIR